MSTTVLWDKVKQRAVLTDRQRFKGLRGTAFSFTLAVDGRQHNLVFGLWLKPNDGDGAEA